MTLLALLPSLTPAEGTALLLALPLAACIDRLVPDIPPPHRRRPLQDPLQDEVPLQRGTIPSSSIPSNKGSSSPMVIISPAPGAAVKTLLQDEVVALVDSSGAVEGNLLVTEVTRTAGLLGTPYVEAVLVAQEDLQRGEPFPTTYNLLKFEGEDQWLLGTVDDEDNLLPVTVRQA